MCPPNGNPETGCFQPFLTKNQLCNLFRCFDAGNPAVFRVDTELVNLGAGQNPDPTLLAQLFQFLAKLLAVCRRVGGRIVPNSANQLVTIRIFLWRNIGQLFKKICTSSIQEK